MEVDSAVRQSRYLVHLQPANQILDAPIDNRSQSLRRLDRIDPRAKNGAKIRTVPEVQPVDSAR
jgi:hypothetical protein